MGNSGFAARLRATFTAITAAATVLIGAGVLVDAAYAQEPQSRSVATTPEQLADLRRLAETGDGEAMVRLGKIYQGGLAGLEQDMAQGTTWFRRAAEAGNAEGMRLYGIRLTMGTQGAPRDVEQGVELLHRAAEAGDAEAMFEVGQGHMRGWYGWTRNPDLALSWYRRAAVAGHPTAPQVVANLEASR